MTRDEIAALIPHAGAMCLLDEAVSWNAKRIHCRSATPAARHPLGRGNPLAAVHLVEYAAQAAALHYGLQSPSPGGAAAGVLAGLNDVRWCGLALGDLDCALDIHAGQALASRQGFIYQFEIFGRDRQLVSGRLTIAVSSGRCDDVSARFWLDNPGSPTATIVMELSRPDAAPVYCSRGEPAPALLSVKRAAVSTSSKR